jgi:hypothetical protein
MPDSYGLSVHGTSVVPENPAGLDDAGPVPYTDVLGYRRGWGTTFRGYAETFNWFHIAVPTLNSKGVPGDVLTVAPALGEVRIDFLTTGTAQVEQVHLWDGHVILRGFLNLNVAGDFRATVFPDKTFWEFQPPLPMQRALGISVGVNFGIRTEGSDILFTTAFARFVIP